MRHDRAAAAVGIGPPGLRRVRTGTRATRPPSSSGRSEPNRLFASEVEELEPGRALDLACGEGRNAVWLADRGWRVTGIDFSDVALAKAERLAQSRGVEVDWVLADVVEHEPQRRGVRPRGDPLPPAAARGARACAATAPAAAVAPGGTLIVLGHDTTNLDRGPRWPEGRPRALHARGRRRGARRAPGRARGEGAPDRSRSTGTRRSRSTRSSVPADRAEPDYRSRHATSARARGQLAARSVRRRRPRGHHDRVDRRWARDHGSRRGTARESVARRPDALGLPGYALGLPGERGSGRCGPDAPLVRAQAARDPRGRARRPFLREHPVRSRTGADGLRARRHDAEPPAGAQGVRVAEAHGAAAPAGRHVAAAAALRGRAGRAPERRHGLRAAARAPKQGRVAP